MMLKGRFAWWPLPVFLIPLSTVFMAAATFLATRGQLQAEFPLWSRVSMTWHESLLIPGSMAVAFSALLGAAINPRASILVLPTRTRSGVQALVMQSAALGIFMVLGHALGMIPVEWQAWQHATSGSLHVPDVVIGSVGLFSLVAMGFAAGASVGSVLAAPIAGMVAFGLLGLIHGPSARPAGLVLPVQGFEPGPRFQTMVLAALFSCLSAVALTGAAISVAAWAQSRRSAKSGQAVAAVWVCCVLALTSLVFIWHPQMQDVKTPVPIRCQAVPGGGRMCLHAANLAAAPDVAGAMTALRRAGLGGVLREVTDKDTVATRVPTPGQALIFVDPGPRASNYFSPDLKSDLLEQIASRFTSDYCIGEDHSLAPSDMAYALQSRVLRMAGYRGELHYVDPSTAVNRRIAKMSAKQVRELLAHRAPKIRACALSPKDVP